MTEAEYSDAKQFYKFAIAYDSFSEISETCEHLLNFGVQSLAPGYYAMAAGIVTLYCRPFTKNDRIGKLDPSLVPQEFNVLHSTLIKLRNKAFAHTDSSGDLQEHGKMTDVRILFDGKSIKSFSSRLLFEPVLLPQIKALSELLAQKVKQSRDNAFKVIAAKFTAADIGKEFELNVEEEKGPMVVVTKDPIANKYPMVREF